MPFAAANDRVVTATTRSRRNHSSPSSGELGRASLARFVGSLLRLDLVLNLMLFLLATLLSVDLLVDYDAVIIMVLTVN